MDRGIRRLAVALRVPLLLLAACGAGFVLWLGLELPGTPVWLGVGVVEAVILLGDRHLRASRRAPAPAPAREPEVAVEPPAAADPWVAEIAWSETHEGVSFYAEARSPAEEARTLARSEPLQWPPGPDTAQAMSRAVDELEASLVAAGWQPIEPGPAWYAKRFAWAAAPGAPAPPEPPRRAPAPPPVEAPHEQEQEQEHEQVAVASGARVEAPARPAQPPPRTRPAPAPAPAAERPRARPARPVRARPKAWPEGTEALVRCEIVWVAAYRTSYFQAVVHAPDGRRPQPIARSRAFKWMLKDVPGPQVPAHVAAVREIRAGLQGDGWEEITAGPAWYSLRFVWRGDSPPDLPALS